VRVRLTPAEYAVWDAVRARSGRREMGAWVRAVINEVTTGRPDHTRRPGDLDRVPELNQRVASQLAGVANNVNQLARWANTEQRAADVAALARLVAEVEAALDAVRGRRRRRTPAGTVGAGAAVASGGRAVPPNPPGGPASASSGRIEPPAPAPSGDAAESRSGSRWRRLLGGRP